MQKQPIQGSLVANTHKAHYRMHKYWSRKPANIVREYIEHYTKPGDVVADPFLGSGVTFIESVLSDRKAVGSDLSPISKHITLGTLSTVDIDALKECFNSIEKECHQQIDELFSTVVRGESRNVSHVVWESLAPCPKCNASVPLFETKKVNRTKFICPSCHDSVNITSSMVNGERMMEIWYEDLSGVRRTKIPDKQDLEKFSRIESMEFESAIKENAMFKSKRTLAHEGMGVSDLFTVRNHHCLSILMHSIRKVKDDNLRTTLEFIFTSSVAQASKLIAYRGGLKSGGPAWTVSGFWVPRKHFELNPWDSFSTKFDKVCKAKEKFQEQYDFNLDLADSWVDMVTSKSANCLLLTTSVTDLSQHIPDGAVDYIFTDPPYGDSVPYIEYCTVWNAWLGHPICAEEEIIISDSEVRNKDINDYARLMKAGFAECYRILKNGGWMSLTFNNRDVEVWKALIDALVDAGFTIVNATYQVPAVVPAKAQLSKSGSGVGDIILNMMKDASGNRDNNGRDFSLEILGEVIDRVIAERGGSATMDQVNRSIYIELMNREIFKFSTTQITKYLKENYTSKKSIISFKDGHEIPPVGLLDVAIEKVVKKALKDGIDDNKEIIRLVFNELQASRTPDISSIKACIARLSSPTTE